MEAISRPCSAMAPALNRAAEAGTAGTEGRRPAGPKPPPSNARCSSAPPCGSAAPNSLVPRLRPTAPRACPGCPRLRYPQAPESLPRATLLRRGADPHAPHPLRREVPGSGPAPPSRHWPPARPASTRGQQVAVLREGGGCRRVAGWERLVVRDSVLTAPDGSGEERARKRLLSFIPRVVTRSARFFESGSVSRDCGPPALRESLAGLREGQP